MLTERVRAIHPAFARARIFDGLAGPDLERLSAWFHPRRFPPDATLLHEGDPATAYYLLAEGQVKILQSTAEGDEVILHLMEPGDLVGALPNLGERTCPASAVALTEVLAFAIDPERFEVVLEQHPRVAVNLLHFAAARLQAAHTRLRELATERVERRIARTLCRLAAQIGRRTPQGVELAAPLSRRDLAEMSGTTLYTVSRTLKAWERQGLLRAGRERITVLNTHGLVALADDLPSPAA